MIRIRKKLRIENLESDMYDLRQIFLKSLNLPKMANIQFDFKILNDKILELSTKWTKRFNNHKHWLYNSAVAGIKYDIQGIRLKIEELMMKINEFNKSMERFKYPKNEIET